VPDGPNKETFESPRPFSPRLPFSGPPADVHPGGRPGPELSYSDHVQERIETSIAAEIQSVAHEPSRGCFDRSNARVGGKLCIRPEPAAGSENPGERPGHDETHAEDLTRTM